MDIFASYVSARRTAAILVLLLFCAGTAMKPVPEKEREYFAASSSIELLGEVYREVSENYVDEVDPAAFMYAGIDGMLESLDPYTVFLDSEEALELDELTSGQYAGIGVRIAEIGDGVHVVSLIGDAGARKAGLRVGDRILKVDGRSLEGKDLEEIKTFIKGPPGSRVSLVVERYGRKRPLRFSITREEVRVNSIRYSGLIGDVGYFEISSFGNRSVDELVRAIGEVRSSAMQANRSMNGVILDLRGNPGGLLDVAVDVTGLFVRKNSPVVSTIGRSHDSENSYRTSREPLVGELPLAVLINEQSASASEIVAGAVQELDRGVIIGERSFGKGLVQSIIALPYDCTLKMTTAKYYTPSGRLIQKEHDRAYEGGRTVLKGKGEPGENGVFYTSNKRKVYGGGGILPDLRIDDDAPGGYEMALRKEGMLFRYANRFRAEHESLSRGDIDLDLLMTGFDDFLREERFLYRTVAELQLDDVKSALGDKPGKETSRALEIVDSLALELSSAASRERAGESEQIALALEQEILRHYDEDAAQRRRIERDPVVKKAIDILRDPIAYRRLLTP
ncbi:peptidase S41 [Prosthecochloris sp. GSB1]|uniref:S41 family peptidase n=1 Tax=Prosthecochloris sp. GSB1 TaxID=281093 RepID=UPI000B8C9E7C|nr:S41 family peptidase [Prosthecochloris sp. GSB1]ASQ89554.1 peptidase S41 [Prosthecochloris sp. GSB1]